MIETFRAHPEMPLRLEHFAATRLNWEPKSANLRSLAEELDLGLDSFILVDNSATECAEVQAGCPEVLALALPAEAGEFAEFPATRLGVRPVEHHRGRPQSRALVRSGS